MGDMNNIPEMSVKNVVDGQVLLYSSAINKGFPVSKLSSLFMWGAPGVGKSDGVRQIAEGIEKNTGKKVVVTDIRLLLFSPIDLRGVPVADVNKEFTEWLKPKIFDLDSSDEVVNIIFLDELSAAPQSVQAAAYQITLDKKIGEHVLPDNCIVIAAGNRTTDKSVAYRMPNALANRMRHVDVKADFNSFREWAVANNIDYRVLGFLSFDNSKLLLEEIDYNDVAFPTPRAWKHVSDMLYVLPETDDYSSYYSYIASCIGNGTAMEFIAWCMSNGDLPDVQEIFNGNHRKYPASVDVLYPIISSIVKYAEEREKMDKAHKLTMGELENVISYSKKFPPDYKACLYIKLCNDDSIRKKLIKIDEFKVWLKDNKLPQLQ